ncbi:MAG: hypothetical protein M2R45_04285 [Verrucomicrobia subdivision 3 bacterium]|nr:hypothetical protein [Limisphaerales bacterium]MCS1417392.1 hypothetical protein [Limisphaerales bacterium]
MNGEEKVVKHLEMTQAVINRLGSNSFLLKGWSMTIIVAAMVLMARYDRESPFILLSLIIPVIGFGILDGYFLWQERLFRKVYDEIRKQETTDFSMNPMKHKDKPKCSWIASTFSVTLNIFYGIEILLLVGVFSILKYYEGY